MIARQPLTCDCILTQIVLLNTYITVLYNGQPITYNGQLIEDFTTSDEVHKFELLNMEGDYEVFVSDNLGCA